MKKLTAVVVGYGGRGATYASYAIDHPEELEIVAVAEPKESRREYVKQIHNLTDTQLYSNWEELAQQPKMADFAIIATQDKMHYEPAMALIEKGYHLLLEKPMAPTPEECKAITEAAEKKGVKVIVCHVLRYTKFWCAVKDMIDNGDLGEIMSVIHMENVGNEHFASSYVKGPWRKESESNCMLMAKSCHDMDLLQWLLGKPCKQVQSFGSLTHFTSANRPAGATDRCTDGCPAADTCIYNVEKVFCANKDNWLRHFIVPNVWDPTDEQILEVLAVSRQGLCVYNMDNDVVDHQVVNMEFEGGCTVSFSVNAFNKGGRFIRIFGTKAELVGDMDDCSIEVFYFDTRETKKYHTEKIGAGIASGHGGGDMLIMMDTLKYLRGETPSKSISSVRTSYESHLIGFAAEKARVDNTIINVEQFSEQLHMN